MKRFLFVLTFCAITPALASAEADKDKARLTFGVPTYVHHPDDRGGGLDWNEGWLNNEGVLADASWPMWKAGPNTNVRLGVTAGGFDNSEFKTSIFAGGVAELEHFATDKWALSLGTYVGAITGYGGITPAIAPYVGTSYKVSDDVELGVRGFWLPGRTLGGESVAASDAYIAAATIGTRF